MGLYILAPDVALRSWEGTPHTYVRRFVAKPMRLSAEEFEVAQLCDGQTELDESTALGSLLRRGVVRACDKDAREETLRAIRMCMEEGVPVRVQVNANRRNEQSIRPTVELLARMGVGRIRVIRTTGTPRWAANAPGATFSWGEYQQLALQTAAWYAGSGLSAELNFWHTITMRPVSKTYVLDRVRYNSRTYRARGLCARRSMVWWP